VAILLAGTPAWPQLATAPSPAVLPNQHAPRLAVTVSVPPASEQNTENWEDLLMIELANQPFLQLVDRQALHAVMKEHAIALSNLSDTKNALALGKFAGADFLLHVAPEEKKASIRLVEVATGQVKLEDTLALANDLAWSSAAIREKVLAALRPDSQAANRLTVGIAAFPNRSGTDRSDKLGIELQKALRSRLKDKAWAVVLERQYPTALLEEVDLARARLVRDKTVEILPPADLVVLGTLQDANNEYVPGKPWEVKLDLTLRLRGRSSQISEQCRSDAIDATADHVMRKIDEFRRQPASQAAVPEKELWRRQALYLMPRQMERWISQDLTMWQNRVIIPNFFWSSVLNQREVIRAWENVLLLDDNDPEALNYLGAYLISVRWRHELVTAKQPAAEGCIAGSLLVERALKTQPNRERAASYVFCVRPLVHLAPARAKEMAQYILDHPEQFKESPEAPWVKVAQTTPLQTTDDGHYAELARALSNAEKDPNAALILFPPGLTRNGPVKQYGELLAKYLDSHDPVVQFIVQRALGELLCWQQKDPAALEHFDKAIAVMEAAYERCKDGHRDSMNNIYRLRIEACQFLDQPEEAKKTALAGAKHFSEIGRFDRSIAWLYDHCVTDALGTGQEKQSLAICNAYGASLKDRHPYYDQWFHLSAKREELLTRLAGKRVPDMSGLQVVKGTEQTGLKRIRMAATDGKLWFTSSQSQWFTGHISAMVCEHGHNSASRVVGAKSVWCVATTKDAVFFGGVDGLYKLDVNGELLAQYNRTKASFPGYSVMEACEGGGKIFFVFQGSPQLGIAALDPATDKISVLAPSSHEATWDTEPVVAVGRLWWDAATPRLYACTCFRYDDEVPFLTRQYGWLSPDKPWQRYPIETAPRFVLSHRDETLLVRVLGKQTEFQFLKAGQKVTAAVPVPSMMGEPAWDDHRIWVPTSSGLYEVDRATSQVTWLAYEDGNWFLSLLKAGDQLYVATSRGLYYRELSAKTARAIASAPSGSAPAKPTPGPTLAASAKPATAVTKAGSVGITRAGSVGSWTGSAALPVELSLEGNAKAEVTITLGASVTLQKALPGTVQLDLTAVGNGKHHLFFHCPGYASQWLSIEVADGKASPKQLKVRLFRKRYVILRCAFNKDGGRKLDGDGVEEQRLALSHWTGPEYFHQDWQIWQKSSGGTMLGDTPYLEFHRYVNGFGFARPAPGVSYEQMKEAPEAGYRCENMKAEKGLVLYCRVNGDVAKEGIGYGKILVEAVTETPPKGIPVIDRP